MKKVLIVLLAISFGTFLFGQEITSLGIVPERSGGSYGTSSQSSLGIPLGPIGGGDDIPLDITGGFLSTLTFDENSNQHGFMNIPPDPIGAAGTDRLVAVVNCMIQIVDKSGVQIGIDALQDFFAPLSPNTLTFDPKVVWDQYENRFVVVTLEAEHAGSNPDAGNTSWIFLAVSKTAFPTVNTSDWHYLAINTKETRGTGCGGGGCDHWADYPGFEVDEEAIYITNNMFAHTGGTTDYTSRLWIVDKGTAGGFYSGGAAAVTTYLPYVLTGVPTYAETTMPAQVYGAGGATGTVPNVGTYLVGYGALSAGSDEVAQFIRVDDPLGLSGGPTFTWNWTSVTDIEPGGTLNLPHAPQMGGAVDIETNQRRALDALWRDDPNHSPILWFVATIEPSAGVNAGQATAHYFMFNTSAWPPFLVHQDDIGAEDLGAGTHTFFPSLAVDSEGNAYFGFAASSAAMYCGAYAAGTHWNDVAGPADPLRPTETIQAGVDYYYRQFSDTRNRWGDYSGAALDPVTENVWIFNEYAMTRGSIHPTYPTQDGRWGTAWGTGDFHLPVILSSFTTEVSYQGVFLNWTTESEVENLGFIIERRAIGGSWQELVSYKTDSDLEGQGSTSSATDYAYLDQLVKEGVTYEYRLADVDYNGVVNYNSVRTVVVDKPQLRSLGIPPEILINAYPNPFNPSATISYGIPSTETSQATSVQVNIYDINGRLVTTLVNKEQPAGWYEVQWTGTNQNGELVPTGMYISKISAGDEVKTTKLMLLR